jgi:hypothetical protein
MADISAAISLDKTLLSVAIHDDEGNVVADHVMDAAQIDIFMAELGKRRAEMTPTIPRKLDPNPVFKNVIRNPVFHIDREHAVSKEIIVAARHDGFGWLGFIVPMDEAALLTLRIAEQVRHNAPKLIVPKGRIIT